MNSKVAQALLLPFLVACCESAFAQKLYWTEQGVDAVSRSNLDGSAKETLLRNPLRNPDGIAIDPATDTVFWSDDMGDAVIRSASADGSNIQLVYSVSSTHEITDLAFEQIGRKLYFVDDGPPHDAIYRMNPDG